MGKGISVTGNVTSGTVTCYGQCDHPAIYQKDGRWYCTECHQLRATRKTQPSGTATLETRLELARIAIDVACEPHLAGSEWSMLETITPAPVQATNDILAAAATTIKVHGWHQDQDRYENEDGEVCVLGAINRNAVNGPARDVAVRLLMDRIEGLHGTRYGSIHAWNDSPATCVDDVLDLLY